VLWGGPTLKRLLALSTLVAAVALGAQAAEPYPIFEVDAMWVKPLPNAMINGDIASVTVDARDHVWIVHRPRTIREDERTVGIPGKPDEAECCRAAPSVIEYDTEGKMVQAWGGPSADGKYDWPTSEHGISVDHKDNVWICGNSGNQCLKFTRDGKFLMQIGKPVKDTNSHDTAHLNRPAEAVVWPATNEVFIADGYGNRRVAVFDADTGAFKRMWGAYGKEPDDSVKESAPETRAKGPPSTQFDTVHGIKIAKDGTVYASDRGNNRIQAFTIDGKFLKEGFVNRGTLMASGTMFAMDFSADPQEKYVYAGDLPSGKIRILDRQTLTEIPGATIGSRGHLPGQFRGLHSLATDSKGNIYTVDTRNARLQKFVLKGMSR